MLRAAVAARITRQPPSEIPTSVTPSKPKASTTVAADSATTYSAQSTARACEYNGCVANKASGTN